MSRNPYPGLISLHDEKSPTENKFHCMKLIEFLTDSGVKDWDDWHSAHISASKGACRYSSVCSIYAITISQKPIQLSLFDNYEN